MSHALSCSYRPPCPGCPRFGDDALDSHALARLSDFGKQRGVPEIEVVTGEGFGYRHRVRLSVRRMGAGIGVGIFEEGSHRLVSIPGCPVHHPAIERVLARLVPLLEEHGVEPYDEVAHRGVLRAVQLAVERHTNRVQLVFIVRDRLGPGSHAAKQLQPVVRDLESADFVGVFLNAQPDKTNTLVGDVFEKVSGEDFLEDTSGGARVFYPPAAFGQANPVLHDEAVRRIHAFVPPGARVVEFHAGVGAIGLGLAASHVLTLNEIGRGSLQGLVRGLQELGPVGDRVRVAAGPADDEIDLVDEADVVVVDPPRKGLSPRLLDKLGTTRPARLAYLSCGLDSFLRDGAFLVESGLRLRSVTALGYFPFTEHVETLALFES